MTKKIVFCGSFKFYREMQASANILKNKGIDVIVPQPSHIRKGHEPQKIKTKYPKSVISKWEGEGAFEHLENIKRGDVVYIFNKGSYIGPAVTVEIGFALALGKPIYSKARIKDVTVSNFIKKVVKPSGLINELR